VEESTDVTKQEAATTPQPEVAYSQDPRGNVGCMLVLGAIILSAPFFFLYSYVFLAVLVALFFAWMTYLVIGKLIGLPKHAWVLFVLLSLGYILLEVGLVWFLNQGNWAVKQY
jgi:VIT1/CCC1 family predicted Fe2+/Mn2+ transporter